MRADAIGRRAARGVGPRRERSGHGAGGWLGGIAHQTPQLALTVVDGGADRLGCRRTCDGCDIVFEGMPPKLDWFSTIAAAGEPGKPMRITGVVRDQKNWPVPGIIVYAYQTDAKGIYPKGTTAHGRLRGWARSDELGNYGFDTIRPGGYPDSAIPQHIHLHVIEPGRATYFIDDIVFSDDPRLTPEARKRFPGRGGDGIVTPTLESKVLVVTRDIYLGKNIPGYPSK